MGLLDGFSGLSKQLPSNLVDLRNMHLRRGRSLLVASGALLSFAMLGAGTADAATTSSNWGGYAVSAPRVKFKHIVASWVQPAATCKAGRRSYSATWVGLGGYHTGSAALEQIGRADQSVAAALQAHVTIGSLPLYLFGNDAQRERWLRPPPPAPPRTPRC